MQCLLRSDALGRGHPNAWERPDLVPGSAGPNPLDSTHPARLGILCTVWVCRLLGLVRPGVAGHPKSDQQTFENGLPPSVARALKRVKGGRSRLSSARS